MNKKPIKSIVNLNETFQHDHRRDSVLFRNFRDGCAFCLSTAGELAPKEPPRRIAGASILLEESGPGGRIGGL
jgi:hypothetical protein